MISTDLLRLTGTEHQDWNIYAPLFSKKNSAQAVITAGRYFSHVNSLSKFLMHISIHGYACKMED